MLRPQMVPALVAAALALSACGTPVGGDPTEYCAAIQTVKDADATMAPLTADRDVAIAAATSPTNPDAIASLNAWGQALSDVVALLNTQYTAAQNSVEDPAVSDALDVLLRLNAVFSQPNADLAIGATSLEDYGNAASAIGTSTEFTSLSESIYTSVQVLDEYTQRACGFSFSETTQTSP